MGESPQMIFYIIHGNHEFQGIYFTFIFLIYFGSSLYILDFMSKSDSSSNSSLKIAVLCGGPSQERGISLNSARSVIDHLTDDNIAVTPF